MGRYKSLENLDVKVWKILDILWFQFRKLPCFSQLTIMIEEVWFYFYALLSLGNARKKDKYKRMKQQEVKKELKMKAAKAGGKVTPVNGM